VVCHILSRAPAETHQLCEHARIDGALVTYLEDAASPESRKRIQIRRRRV
jgi:hypothetical protein